MGFALNRISCGLYYQGQFEEAAEQNYRCIELMDDDNIYATYYNAGIFCRKLGSCERGLDFFEKVDFKLIEGSRLVGWSSGRRE